MAPTLEIPGGAEAATMEAGIIPSQIFGMGTMTWVLIIGAGALLLMMRR
jgi:hypothetical protein